MADVIYGFLETEIGRICAAYNNEAVCFLAFAPDEDSAARAVTRIQALSHDALRSDAAVGAAVHVVLKAWRNDTLHDIACDTLGTAFQRDVWAALRQIPKGAVWCYSDIAEMVGKPKAARAVGTAIGQNPISLIIPCHRVVQKSGVIGHYAWGSDVKRSLLQREGVAFRSANTAMLTPILG